MDLTVIRNALATVLLGNIGGDVRVYAYRVQAPEIPDVGVALVVEPGDPMIDPDKAFQNQLAEVFLTVRAYVRYPDARRADERLDALLSFGVGADKSILDAIYNDPTLGGIVQDCHVVNLVSTGLDRPFLDQVTEFWTASVDVQVYV